MVKIAGRIVAYYTILPAVLYRNLQKYVEKIILGDIIIELVGEVGLDA